MIQKLKRKFHYSLSTGLLCLCISSEVLFEDLAKLIVIPSLGICLLLNIARFSKNRKEVN